MPSAFARALRANATEAEIRLWSKLRRKQLDGFRFRRQQPMGQYIVDFFCPEASLIIEVDGGQHADESPVRAAWLKSRGYRVMRFWNNEVLANTDGVLDTILDALKAPGDTPPSLPSPSRGKGLSRERTTQSEASRKIQSPEKKSSPPLRGRVREGGRDGDQPSTSPHPLTSPPTPPSPSRGEGCVTHSVK